MCLVAAKALSDMMGAPLFLKEEVDAEREVVIEEIKQGEDSPQRRVSREIFSYMYPKHPYGLPVIGCAHVVKNISIDKIRQYFEQRYSTDNMYLLVVGDFSVADQKLIEQEFMGLQQRPIRKVERLMEASLSGGTSS